jgi:SNF2 family DNA or RNA helicase
MALGVADAPPGVQFEEARGEGWIGELLGKLVGHSHFEELPPPAGFQGILRPYQLRGFSWLGFLRQYGLGACLADDMGLGKTVQALAMLERDRAAGVDRPALLICPTSVVGNWRKEAARFAPDLPVLVHHGLARIRGQEFAEQAARHGLVISSYALAHRDLDVLKEVAWSGIILDEAQNIKNPETRQSRAARSLTADYRIALTGTPVENNVGELWSIMDFLNPGFLGNRTEFNRRFLLPIQKRADSGALLQLRKLTAPFILRRLKTDSSVILDLPEKMEMKVFCNLTPEQASLYRNVVEEATRALEGAEGIRRKGVILAALTKLKQVCNHPAQLLGDQSPLPGRSGKLSRLTEMADELLSEGDRALIFSQFADMGERLQRHLSATFGEEVLFLHGGVPAAKRDRMVEHFQSGGKGSPRLFVLSLKAGGTGLNLTAANHVFHFDRWWNPAVENQATDRAFRIGQKRNVQIHKFVCVGTLEERIDEMIERKKAIADHLIGAGEAWLTELSTAEIKQLFALRQEAIS